jgi:pyruvate dehydrogenase E1 component alpha subunit
MDKLMQLQMYHEMVLIRRVEERGAELYQQGKIGGFMHLYIGQEAVSTGLIAAREPRDRVIPPIAITVWLSTAGFPPIK